MMRSVAVVSVVMSIILFVFSVQALAFSSCEFDLDTLGSRARNASFEAEQAGSTCRQLDSCRQFPETFDLMRDGCSSHRQRCDSAKSSLEAALQGVDAAIKGVRASCGMTTDTGQRKISPPPRKSLRRPQQ